MTGDSQITKSRNHQITKYSEDLAYIHDAGHTAFARDAAPGLLALLRRHGVTGGLVVDLGCGSGVWARELTRAGYDVLSVDISPAMIRLARQRAPKARFLCASFLRVDLPPCAAVTSIGECLNYCFDKRNTIRELIRLFRRVHAALRPGGLFVLDVAEPRQMHPRNTTASVKTGLSSAKPQKTTNETS